jgi:hypothetical protein
VNILAFGLYNVISILLFLSALSLLVQGIAGVFSIVADADKPDRLSLAQRLGRWVSAWKREPGKRVFILLFGGLLLSVPFFFFMTILCVAGAGGEYTDPDTKRQIRTGACAFMGSPDLNDHNYGFR